MDLHLSDKVALIAGSSRGIGFATARSFLAEGCRTAITGRDRAALHSAKRALETEFGPAAVMAFEGDIGLPAVAEKILASIQSVWGGLDCLVANVGGGRGPAGWDVPESDWLRLFEDNVSSTYRLVQQVLPGMIRARSGSIVMVASIVGTESVDAPLPYSAAKAALINYGKNLARQVGEFNVRVNSVAPGNVLAPGGSLERHLAERREEVLRQIDLEVPMRRFGRPEEIGDLIAFLCSDRAAFITGSCVVADGGQTRGYELR